jgi:hypothetical protein
MKPNVMLIIASLLSIILMIFHMTDDIVRGMEPGTLFDLIIVPVLAVWLYGALVLRERRSGYVIVLVASLLGLLVAIIHMKGAGVGGAIAKSSGGFFFIWTLIALGVTSLFSIMLSVRALSEQLRGRTGQRPTARHSHSSPTAVRDSGVTHGIGNRSRV